MNSSSGYLLSDEDWGRNGAVHALAKYYKHVMHDLRDTRVDNWAMASSVWPTTGVCLAYIFLVRVVAPRVMKDRSPYQMKQAMLVYNIVQTVFSGWVFLECARLYFSGRYNWHCQPVDYSDNPDSVRILHVGYYFYLSKFADMLDSFFFAARKKFGNLSNLHVIHHCIVPWFCWFGVKFVCGGNTMFGVMFNSCVHTIMYFYYLLAACGPQVQPYLWWKKYLTSFQMVQFVVVFLHTLQPLFFECDYPKVISFMVIFNCILFYVLFNAFYKKAYKKETKKET